MHIGIDGCSIGWVVAVIEDTKLKFEVITSLDYVKQFAAHTMLIDMPVGFAEKTYRTCEIEARKLLGKQRGSSIFFTPHINAVFAKTYAEANSINRHYTGKGISIQAWNICKKIIALHEFLEANPSLQIQESHPELCFYQLNNSMPVAAGKSTKQGLADRIQIISRQSKDYTTVIEQTMLSTKRKDVQMDDLLDATIMAIRSSMGNLQYIPGDLAHLPNQTIAY